MAQELWVDRRDDDYWDARNRREYARDHYTGAVLDAAQPISRVHTLMDNPRVGSVLLNIPKKARAYLHQRSQGEADPAFAERLKISRYPGHMSTLVDSFVGGVFSVEDKAFYSWGPKLGEPTSDGITRDVWRDIDGSGTNWKTRLIQKTADLVVDEWVYYYADRSGPRTRIFSIDPDQVVQTRTEEGRLVEVLIEEFATEQGSLTDPVTEHHYYTHYTVDGWWKYELIEDPSGDRQLVLDSSNAWKYPFWDSAEKNYKRLPIGRVRMPLRRPVGYQMARDANMLYNMLSDARWLYRVLNYPRLAGDVEDDQWEKSLEALREGMNALQGKWEYISPPHENATSVYADYRAEVREFYISNHQRANQSAIERSATEILYNEAAGRTAFLTLLSQTVDEMENDWLSLLAQLEYPKNPEEWSKTFVERSRDFKPIDADQQADRMANRFAVFSGTFPAALALELAGASEEDIAKANTFNPVPEDAGFGEDEEDPAPTEGQAPELD